MKAPTLKDVAARAGVALGTASAALAGQKIVRAETRARVEAAARELGYRRNAAAAVMAARRRRARRRERLMSLGYLVAPQAEERRPAAFARCAEKLGYGVEWIDLRAFRSGAEASRVLFHRNVAALFYSSPGAVPTEEAWLRGFVWERFACVKFTRSRPELRFPLIRHSAFDYAERTLREVFAAGYRRVVALMIASTSPVDDQARVGAVLGWKALRQARGESLQWRLLTRLPQAGLDDETLAWLKKQAPEAVVGFPDLLYWKLRESGFSIPQDFAFAGMLGTLILREVATCHANLDLVREKAVDFLHQMITNGQRGMVLSPSELVIEPEWHPGSSLPILSPNKA